MNAPAANPVLMAFPYLPLAEPVEFGGWWLGSLADFHGPWVSTTFERRSRQFLSCFVDSSTKPIASPSLLVRASEGADGAPPDVAEQDALRLAVGFAVVHHNLYWNPSGSREGWRVATADNADLWIQPLDPEGRLALGRGARVTVTTGGLSLDREGFVIPAPQELHLPTPLRLDAELLIAAYTTLLQPRPERKETAAGLRVAMRWLLKSWQNSASITWEDRLVYLKIASEALTQEDNNFKSAQRLHQIFERAGLQEGGDIGLDNLLWSPNEPTLIRRSRSGEEAREAAVSQFVHWCCALGDARNAIVHGEDRAELDYSEASSPYNGPFVEVADRVVREAICVVLGACGFPAVWRQGITRASFHAMRRLAAESGQGSPA